jgi:uncharacterized protein (DUF362 family)/Pyruvate/2-oxoacid:ferredoxin oxidoreductase delta subunit
MHTVSLVRCEDYGRENVFNSVSRAIEILGGIDKFVKPGMRVLVKPNILQASGPEAAVCTHPDVVYSVCRILKEHGCRVIIAESPGAGSIYGSAQLKKAYETTGYAQFAEELGIELNYDVSYEEVANPEGSMIKRFLIIKPAREVDAIIVVSKLKTHLFTGMTAATKNLFGLVPGMEKATFHGRLIDPLDFSRMLVDLNELVRPALQIMDAIIGMEGDGPYSGEPRKIGAVLASSSYAGIDVVAARLIGIPPLDIPTIKAAVERGILDKDLEGIEVKGENIESFDIKDFKLPPTYANGRNGRTGTLLRHLMKMTRVYALRPIVVREKCVGCGRCIRACPVQTIKIRRGKAKVKHSDCIRCYTCHEMCTSQAIVLKRSFGGKVTARLVERRSRDV